MKNWAAIVAFIIRWYDRYRMWAAVRKGKANADKQWDAEGDAVLDAIHSDNPVDLVPDDDIIRADITDGEVQAGSVRNTKGNKGNSNKGGIETPKQTNS